MRPDCTQKSYNLNFFDRSIEGFANMGHELVQLAENIDWSKTEKSLEGHFFIDLSHRSTVDFFLLNTFFTIDSFSKL